METVTQTHRRGRNGRVSVEGAVDGGSGCIYQIPRAPIPGAVDNHAGQERQTELMKSSRSKSKSQPPHPMPANEPRARISSFAQEIRFAELLRPME